MRTIACVLRAGVFRNRRAVVRYKPEHVQWLQRMVRRFVRVPHRFLCLTNVAIPDVEVIPLRDDLAGWWSKMELFRELDQAFYVDLDTVIVGDITEMVEHPHRFTVLRNLSSTATNRIGSGVMAWEGDCSHLYREFMSDAKRHMAECVTSEKWGDQGFIQSVQASRDGWEYFQDLFPGQIRSFKVDMRQRGNPPDDCRIVCFHGQPKPWEHRAAWVPELEAA